MSNAKLIGTVGSISANVRSDSGGHSPAPYEGDSRDSDSKKKEEDRPALKLVEPAPPAPAVDPDAFFKKALPEADLSPAVQPPATRDPNSIGRTNALLQAFQMLQKQKEAVVKWLGLKAYTGNKSRGKRITIRKGVIVDKQVD